MKREPLSSPLLRGTLCFSGLLLAQNFDGIKAGGPNERGQGSERSHPKHHQNNGTGRFRIGWGNGIEHARQQAVAGVGLALVITRKHPGLEQEIFPATCPGSAPKASRSPTSPVSIDLVGVLRLRQRLAMAINTRAKRVGYAS